ASCGTRSRPADTRLRGSSLLNCQQKLFDKGAADVNEDNKGPHKKEQVTWEIALSYWKFTGLCTALP
nr:hypothetical protein [Tanacetum cinerariifolium]